MRVAILGMAILAASAAPLIQGARAEAGEPAARAWKAPPRTAPGPMPRPVIPASIAPNFPPAPTVPRTPLPQPITARVVKPPNYSKRSMALIQQNIALQAAMRGGQASSASRCKASWSQDKLRRKGCLTAPPEPRPSIQGRPP